MSSPQQQVPQLTPVLATCVAALVGRSAGISWQVAQEGIVDGIRVGLRPTLILLAAGMLIGSWILCGTVPAMIYGFANIALKRTEAEAERAIAGQA